MRLDHRKLFNVPLNRREKEILDRVAVRAGLSRCAVLRQLLIREHQTPSKLQALAHGVSDR